MGHIICQQFFTWMEIPEGSLAWALQNIQHKAIPRHDIFKSFLKWSIKVSLIWTSNLLPCAIFPSKCKYAISSINSCVAMFSLERPYKASKAIFKDCFRKRFRLNFRFSSQETDDIRIPYCEDKHRLCCIVPESCSMTFLQKFLSPFLYHRNFGEPCAACKETQNWINNAHGCQNFHLYRLFHSRQLHQPENVWMNTIWIRKRSKRFVSFSYHHCRNLTWYSCKGVSAHFIFWSILHKAICLKQRSYTAVLSRRL